MEAHSGVRVWRAIGVAVILALAGSGTVGVSRATEGKKVSPAPETLARGEALYRMKCAECHGTDGRGDGPAAYLVYPKPRDFTGGRFKIRSTMTLPTDEDLFRVITDGIAGTSMPAWAVLTEQDRWALVAYVKRLSPVFKAEPAGEPVAIPKPPAQTRRLLALGKKFYTEAGCFDCHGTTGKGDGPAAATLQDDWGYPVLPYDFTTPGKMKGGSAARDIYRTLQVGIGGTPMPSYEGALTEEETWALAYYTLSLAKEAKKNMVVTESGTIQSRFVAGKVPADPLASAWMKTPATRVPLRTLWMRARTVDHVTVRSLHNGERIAFLIEWNDAIADHEVLRSEDFRDAAAVQFPAASVALHGPGHAEPSYMMGDSHGLVNIWHWKADWEADLQRYQDVQDRYTRMATDLYVFNRGAPPGSPTTAQVRVPTASHDPTYLTGWGAGNLLSTPTRHSSVEDLNAVGFGTLTSQPPEDQNVEGRGVWKEGKWRVVMVREMRSKSERDTQFHPGQSLPVAFAIWDGAEGDRDGQKAVSIWQQLDIEAAR